MASQELPIRDTSSAGANGIVEKPVSFGHSIRDDFLFDKDFINLNHGSFGTYPHSIRSVMRVYQDKAEARPDQFIRYDYPNALDESRAVMSKFLNVPVDTLVFVQNTTTGINTVLRNLVFKPGEKIVYFATIYGACEKSVEYIVETTPAEAVKISYTYPVSDDWMVDEFRKVVRREQDAGNTVKVAIFDVVVSLPGVLMPYERLAEACKELGVLSCVDGAHGVGHLALDLGKLDCDFFISNCHKWFFVPRGCAIFYVPIRNQHLIRSTLPTSHGFEPLPRPGVNIVNPLPPSRKPPYIANFEFVGTIDNAPYLCIPEGLKYRERIGGEAAIYAYNHKLAREGGQRVAKILGTEVLENEEGTLGNCCFTNVRLPLKLEEVISVAGKNDIGVPVVIWVSAILVKEYGTFMALIFYDNAWWVRLSAQIYLELGDFEWAAEKLKEVCGRVMKGEFLQADA